MDIQSLGILKDATIQGNTTTVKNAESNFRQLFEKITGGELAREIRDNYDVTLNAGNVVNCDQFLETNEWSFVAKMNWVDIVKDIMQSEYSYGDLKGYMEWQKFLGFLDK